MKRYTETEKWDSLYFSELTPEAKLAYLFIIDKCNSIGVWGGNWKVLNFYTGFSGSIDELKRELRVSKTFEAGTKFIETEDGKIIVTGFLKFQFPNGLHSKKPIVVGALRKVEASSYYDLFIKINGGGFFGKNELKEVEHNSNANDCNGSVSEGVCWGGEVEKKTEEPKEENVKEPKDDAKPSSATGARKGKTDIQGTAKRAIKEEFGVLDEKVFEAFREYAEKRRSMKAPLTERGTTTLLNKLKGLNAESWVNALNDATDNAWKSVFPKNGFTGRGGNSAPPPVGEMFGEDDITDLELKI